MMQENNIGTTAVVAENFAGDVNKVLEQVAVEIADVRQLAERVTSLRSGHPGFFSPSPVAEGIVDNIEVLQQLYDRVMDTAHHYMADRSDSHLVDVAASKVSEPQPVLFSS